MVRRFAAAALLFALGLAWWFALPDPSAPVAASSDAGVAPAECAASATAPRDAKQHEGEQRDAATAARALPSCRARVHVVDAAGEPVAGALVRYLPPSGPATRDAFGERYLATGDHEEALAAAGVTAVTDAGGCVEIDSDPETIVCARRGDDYGASYLPRNLPVALGDVRVELRRDVTLRLEVVDTAGRPVPGNSVCVEARYASRSRGLCCCRRVLGPTDSAGIAIMRHALHELEVDALVFCGVLSVVDYRGDSDSEPTVLAELEQPIAGLQPQTTVRLTIPAGGTIVVTATDADGGPFDHSVWLVDENGKLFDQAPEVHGAEHVFRNVPCGRQWRVEASDGGMLVGAPDNVVRRFDGPRTGDEVVAVAMQVPVRVWRLQLRLVRSDGRRLAMGQVHGRCPVLDIDDICWTVDGRGEVRGLEFRGAARIDDLAPLELRVESPFCRPRTVVLARAIRGGTTDLGEIVVEPPADETLLARVELRHAGKTLTDVGSVGLFREGAERPEPLPALVHSVDGVWELRGSPPQGRMLLSCQYPHFVEPPLVSLRVGEHRVVELQPAASLCVALQANGLPIAPVGATLIRIDGERTEHGRQIDDVLHTVVWAELVPGRYQLRINFGERVVHEVTALELHAGENRWPADGARFDLRSELRPILIATSPLFVVDGVELMVVESGATALPSDVDRCLTRDYGWVLAPKNPFDVLVRTREHVPQRLVNPTADVELTLQPCTWIDLEAAVAWDAVRVHILSDAVTDPLLRAFDHHPHASEFEVADHGLLFAPGTVLELAAVRDGKSGAPLRVVVGDQSPQIVTLP